MYSKTGDISRPLKWHTSVVTILVGKSAFTNRLKTRLVLNGGGMQYNI